MEVDSKIPPSPLLKGEPVSTGGSPTNDASFYFWISPNSRRYFSSLALSMGLTR
jgi:hypothetical protein